MRNSTHIFLLSSILFFGASTTALSQPDERPNLLAFNKLKKSLLRTSKTADKLLPMLLKEALISQTEYDSIVADNNSLRLLLNNTVIIDSTYLSVVSFAYATIDEFILYVNERQQKLSQASKKLQRSRLKHLRAVRQTESAIIIYNRGSESTKKLRFGLFSQKQIQPI